MKKSSKKLITEHLEEVSAYIEGNLSHVISWLEARAAEGWESIDMEYEQNLGLLVRFTKSRQETDQEYKTRISKEKSISQKSKAQKLSQERKLYEKLKKKFKDR